MKLTAEEIRLARGGSEPLLRRLRPVFHQCARAGCVHARAPLDGFVEDVNQELWILFLGPTGERFDPEFNIEPWLIEVSRRIALGLMRKLPREISLTDLDGSGSNGPLEALEQVAGASADSAFGVGENTGGTSAEGGIDRGRALQYLINKCNIIRDMTMHFVVAEDPSEAIAGPLPDVGQAPRKPAKSHLLTPLAEELHGLRNKMRLTHEEMAMRLGLKIPTYQSYEYGKVKKVPDDVMERARAMLKDQDYSYIVDRFKGKSMQDIAGEWARRLGIEPSVSGLARMLGVNKSTVSRWMADQSEPTPYELLRYESIVEQQEQRLARAKAGQQSETSVQ